MRLKTKDAKDELNFILSIIKTFAKTERARKRIESFKDDAKEIGRKGKKELEKRFDFVQEAKNKIKNFNKNQLKEIEKLLEDVSEIKERRMKIEDVIATESEEIYKNITKELEKTNIDAELLFVKGKEDFDYLRDCEFVRYISYGSRFASEVSFFDNFEVVENYIKSYAPEAILGFFSENKKAVESALKITEIYDRKGIGEMEDYQKKKERLESTLRSLGENCSIVSERTERLRKAIEDFEYLAVEECRKANKRIEEELGKTYLKGSEVIEIFSKKYESFEIPEKLSGIIYEEAYKAEKAISEKAKLQLSIISGLLTEHIAYPLEINNEKLFEIRQKLASELKSCELREKQKLAIELSELRSFAEKIIERAFEIDFEIALGKFASQYDISKPGISESLCIAFKNGANIELIDRIGKENVEKVSYCIGSSSLFPDLKEDACIITGANSGGKTTLLELILQIAILANLGIGAPAEKAEVGLIEEVYFFKKKQKSDAGAFESMLRKFESISLSEKRKLVLADELEAVTEPGAAAKVIASIIDFLSKKHAIIVFVSHLGEEIKEHARHIRVDGIEARGLDENLRLIVDRNPRFNKVAKSTPELIVERLAKIRKKEIYNKILEKLKEKKVIK